SSPKASGAGHRLPLAGMCGAMFFSGPVASRPKVRAGFSVKRRRGSLPLWWILTLSLWAPSCAKQGEGERCDRQNSGEDSDCESGLVCKAAATLRVQDGVDRCCPSKGGGGICEEGAPIGTGGTGGTGIVDGSSDSAPTLDGGGCQWSSQCPDGQVCGPSSRCQAECIGDRDCTPPKICVSYVCATPLSNAGMGGGDASAAGGAAGSGGSGGVGTAGSGGTGGAAGSLSMGGTGG
ncbi:MAG TPA: hypothetical protein VGJ84_23310, partial [Polyangiaceae bacterium]